jgi:hypothetical protein
MEMKVTMVTKGRIVKNVRGCYKNKGNHGNVNMETNITNV